METNNKQHEFDSLAGISNFRYTVSNRKDESFTAAWMKFKFQGRPVDIVFSMDRIVLSQAQEHLGKWTPPEYVERQLKDEAVFFLKSEGVI